MVIHNSNLAVVSDAEQVIYVDLDKKNNKFSTIMGSIENKSVNKKIVEVLEELCMLSILVKTSILNNK